MNYKYFTSPPLIFMSKRQTINVTFVSLMSTIILLFTQSHASPKPCVGCHHSWALQLFSKGGPAWTITRGTGCHRVALPEKLLASNKTIPVTKLQYNKWMWSAAWDGGLAACAAPDPDCGFGNESLLVNYGSDNSRHWIWHVTRDVMSRRMSSGTNQHWFAYRPCHRCLITSFCSTPAHRSGSMANGVFVLLSDIQILALPAQVHKYVDSIQIYDQ